MDATNEKLTEDIYCSFTEAEGGVNHPLQDAWNAYQDANGEIMSGDLVEALVIEAIRYAVDYLKDE